MYAYDPAGTQSGMLWPTQIKLLPLILHAGGMIMITLLLQVLLHG